jgi:hypothetical protein
MHDYFSALTIFWAVFVAVIFGINHFKDQIREDEVPELVKPWWWNLLWLVNVFAAVITFSAGYALIHWLSS